jgi:hypothetical protein
MEAGIEIDRVHSLPRFDAHGKDVIGLAARRRSAVNEMRHPSDRAFGIAEQRLARICVGKVADPGHRKLRPR